jgi:hypothetical protein
MEPARSVREAGGDELPVPSLVKQMGGRPAKHKADDLLDLLGDQRLRSAQWSKLANTELGITNGPFPCLAQET